MSDKEHTPVEWFFCGSFVYQVDSDGNKRKVADCTSKPLNQIAIVGDQEEWKANAHLIAAAPDLLEALKDCCVIARPGNPSSCCPVYRPGEHGGCAENEDCECNIWKAIQKAKKERQ